MKKILKYLGILLLALLLFILIAGLFLPTKFHVERSIEVSTSTETAQRYMKDLSHFEQWSPFKKYDTNTVVTLKGKPGEIGSSYNWKGNSDVGSGSMEISAIEKNNVTLRLKFVEPWESECEAHFIFKSTKGKTTITWSINGDSPYPFNTMCLFMDMDNMMGKDFESGLLALKTILEHLPQNTNPFNIEEVTLSPHNYIGKRAIVKFEHMQAYFAQNLGLAFQAIGAKKLTMAGAPSGLFFLYDEKKMECDMAAVIPVSEKTTLEGFETWTLSGKALHIAYYGAYENSFKAHYALNEYIESHALKKRSPVIEEYVTDPSTERDTSKWLTDIYYLIE